MEKKKKKAVTVIKGWAVFDPKKKKITGAFANKNDLNEAMYLEDGDKILRCEISFYKP